jgi:hypothetical protein
MLLNKKYKINNYSPSEIGMIFLAVFCFVYALYLSLKYANQALLDNYSFRQTQTALTAYWLGKNGFSLAYETPVAGPPWSIPFEFPIYQYIVALASRVTKCSLDATGRVVSFLFLALCLIPARAIIKNLNLSNSVFYIFVALLFSSPLYLYWGRTFMIETTAIFFSIASIKYFIDIAQSSSSFKNSSLFLIFIILSILQKATTGLPVLAILGLVYFFLSMKELFSNIEEKKASTSIFLVNKIMLALLYFGVPLAICIIWTLYTDQIKTLNGLGVSLTSSALSNWNWGSVNQRLSFDLYGDVIWKRIFERNLSGALGVAILMIALFSNAKNSLKLIIIISALMGLVPLFLFTNLHIVHTYYQTGNLIFLIFAIAVSLGHVLNNYFDKKIILFVLMMIMVVSNYFWFSDEYLAVVKTKFNKENSRDYAISEILKREIPEGKYFVAFGNDWSSSFAYLAERKSFTVPGFFKGYDRISLYPENFIDEVNLGSVVVCPSGGHPSLSDLSEWASNNRHWKIGETHGCYIAVPEAPPVDKTLKPYPAECQGNIDFAGELPDNNHNIITVTGWTTISGQNGTLPKKVYITLTKKNSEPIFFETLQVNRPDINAHFGKPNFADAGFSRVINTNSLVGEYVVGVTRLNQGHIEVCQFLKKVLISGKTIHE